MASKLHPALTPGRDDACAGSISADFLRAFPTLVQGLGGDYLALLRAVSISPRVLEDAMAPVSLTGMGDLLELAATSLHCPDFGLRLAELQGGRSFEPLDRLVCNAPTLGEALRYSSTFMEAYGSGLESNLERTTEPGWHILRLEFLEPAERRTQLVEQLLLLAYNGVVRLSDGKGRPREIWLQHDKQAPLAAYMRRFKTPVRFGQDIDGLFFTDSDLQAEVVNRNDHVFDLERELIAHKFPAKEMRLEMRVQRAIELAFVEGRCTREHVAEYMQLHVKTLHRRLTAEGTSFLEIRDRVRRKLALRYLARPDLSLVDVTGRLGFSETPVLTRVCRRWFGETPSKLRRRLVEAQIL